jgi:hypothetical protein
MVHRRTVADQEVVFGNQGALWGNAMTWWDHDTGSVWSQPLGEAILGPRKGERLELLPSSLVTWRDWKEQHPDTVALDAPNNRSGFDLDQMAIVVEIGPDSVAFPITELRQVQVANETVNGVPVAVVVDPVDDQWTVFARQLDDRIVEIDVVDGQLAEVGGEARWDPVRGLAQVGEENLNLLPAFTSFPKDYVTFFPEGAFWTSEGVFPVS